jgi:hypothetical protein
VQRVCAILKPLQAPDKYCLCKKGSYLLATTPTSRVFDILKEGSREGARIDVSLTLLPSVRAQRLAMKVSVVHANVFAPD